jgi:hypothetical protein
VNAAEPHLAELLRPLPAETNDGNEWVDGWCWLWCGWQYTRVLWIGAIGTPGANAPLYACGPCIQLLSESVWDYAEVQNALPRDEWGRDIPLYRSATADPPALVGYRRGRHRKARTPLGERFLRAITEPDDRTSLSPPCQRPRPDDVRAAETLASVR